MKKKLKTKKLIEDKYKNYIMSFKSEKLNLTLKIENDNYTYYFIDIN
jgi:hypothetical protein